MEEDAVIPVGSLRIYSGLTAVSLTTEQTVSVSGQIIHTTLQRLRMWGRVDTTQPINCSGETSSWSEIVFGDLLYGDNFAIAAVPLCSIEEAYPIRKNPPLTWGAIDTLTTTAWNTVET